MILSRNNVHKIYKSYINFNLPAWILQSDQSNTRTVMVKSLRRRNTVKTHWQCHYDNCKQLSCVYFIQIACPSQIVREHVKFSCVMHKTSSWLSWWCITHVQCSLVQACKKHIQKVLRPACKSGHGPTIRDSSQQKIFIDVSIVSGAAIWLIQDWHGNTVLTLMIHINQTRSINLYIRWRIWTFGFWLRRHHWEAHIILKFASKK